MKKLTFITLVLFISVLFISCKTLQKNENGKRYYKTHNRNLIGITGKDSSAPYIEIYYSIKKTESENEVVHLWVKPPFIFGDTPVVSQIEKKCLEFCLDIACLSFEEKGGSFTKIINHSDNPIEIFIATTDKTQLGEGRINYEGCSSAFNVTSYPRPLYKNAPIYYLLRPHKTPNLSNLNILSYEADKCVIKNLAYTPTKVGDINLQNAFSVEDAMKLYRAEYQNNPDTVLTIIYDRLAKPTNSITNHFNVPIRISKLPIYEDNVVSSDVDYRWQYSSKKDMYIVSRCFGFYKKINPRDSFDAAKAPWFPITDHPTGALNEEFSL